MGDIACSCDGSKCSVVRMMNECEAVELYVR